MSVSKISFPQMNDFGLNKPFTYPCSTTSVDRQHFNNITYGNLPTVDPNITSPAPQLNDNNLNLHANSPAEERFSDQNRAEFQKWTAPQAPSSVDMIYASSANRNLEENDKLLDIIINSENQNEAVDTPDDVPTDAPDTASDAPMPNIDRIKPLETRSQMAEEHDVSDEELADTVKANEQAVAEDSNELWISTVLADELSAGFVKLAEIADMFKNMVGKDTEWFNNTDKVKTDDRGETRISVDTEKFKSFADKYNTYSNLVYNSIKDILSFLPEKPVEIPLHPNRTEDVCRPKRTQKFNEELDKQFAEDRKGYSNPGFKFTPEYIESIVKGDTPAYGSYHLGAASNMDDLAKLPLVTPDQYNRILDDIKKESKTFTIDGGQPKHEPPYVVPPIKPATSPAKPNEYYDAFSNNMAIRYPAPPQYPSTPYYFNANGDDFNRATYLGSHDPSNSHLRNQPSLKKPTMDDLPKELVMMITKLPNDFWKYEIKQDGKGSELNLTYDIQDRHIHISVLKNKTVFVTSKKKFRGEFTTQFIWDDCVIGINRKTLLTWLSGWISTLFG